MKTINLRWIYTHYRHDEFVEVSDEVWEAMRQAQREMNNYERRKVYHRAWYSLDAYSWTENYALEHGRSPEDILVEREEMTTRLRLIAALPAALAHATPTQARRVHAYYIAGIKQPETAESHGGEIFEEKLAQRSQAMEIHKVLHGLSEPYKEVFSLRTFGELTFREIGMLFGKSENWARVTYYRARVKIREELEQ